MTLASEYEDGSPAHQGAAAAVEVFNPQEPAG